jgi:A/G-specific adenine glycosylase
MKRLLQQPASPSDAGFSADLIAWQKQHGRHQLPWQNTRDPYRIWLSEIMLQQTQVAAVIPYYQRFLQSFDNVAALAAAPQEEVMAHWSGLGYYSRARNLHRCAQQVMAEHGGQFPADVEQLVQLPGIGRSTAAAIAAFAFGAQAAILDGNVKRVFCRVFGIEGFPGEKRVENSLWQRAESLMPKRDIESYTQGLMDLGATLCVRSRPLCSTCPLQARCVAAATGRTAELPMRKPKKAVPEKSTVMLVVVHQGEVLMEQRPQHGIWGGLFSLPELSRMQSAMTETVSLHAMEVALLEFGEVASYAALPEFSHGFTHYKLQVKPVQVQLVKRFQLAAQSGYQWVPLRGLGGAALPAPVKKLLMGITEQG